MFKGYQKLLVKLPTYDSNIKTTVYYITNYVHFERDSNLHAIPQTKMIVQEVTTNKLYHICPADIIEIIDGLS